MQIILDFLWVLLYHMTRNSVENDEDKMKMKEHSFEIKYTDLLYLCSDSITVLNKFASE